MLGEACRSSGSKTTAVGKQIKISESAVGGSANVFVAFSTSCHFCNESLDFYKRAIKERQRVGKVRVTFLSMQPESEVRKYLADHGIEPDSVAAVPPELSISGTPTVLVTGPDGVVKNQFVGKLSANGERDLSNDPGKGGPESDRNLDNSIELQEGCAGVRQLDVNR
jgi:hypothetical protein